MSDRYGKRYSGYEIFNGTQRGTSGTALKYVTPDNVVEIIGLINAIFTSNRSILEIEQLIRVGNGYDARTVILHSDGRIT